MRIHPKPVLWISGFVVCGLIVFILILPGIIRSKVLKEIERATGRKPAIDAIALNPFTLGIKIDGFRLAERNSGIAFASFSSARIRVSPMSLARRGLVVAKLQVTSPYLHVVRTAPNSYNFSDLISGKKPAREGTFQFSVNNIVIKNGSIDFRDEAVKRPVDHKVRQMDIAVPFISNMPYLADDYVKPHFSALVNNARYAADGRLKPMDKTAEMSFSFSIRDEDIPTYMAYIPGTIPVIASSGKLSASLDLSYRVSAKAQPEISLAGSLGLSDLQLRDRRGDKLLALGTGAVRINRADLIGKRFDLNSLETSRLELFPERDARGRWVWQRLIPGAATAKKGQKEDKGPKPVLKTALVRLSDSRVHFRDRVPSKGFSTDLDRFEVTVKGLSTEPGKKAGLDLSFHTGRDETVSLKGEFSVDPPAMQTRLDVKAIDAGGYFPYLADTLAHPLTGKIDVSSDIAFTADGGLVLSGIELAGHSLALSYGKKEGVRLTEVSLHGGNVNLKEKKADVEVVAIAGGDLRFSRNEDGSLSHEKLFLVRKVLAGTATTRKTTTPPFAYRVKKVEGDKLDATFIDRTLEGDPSFPLRRLRFSLKEITGPRSGAMPFTLATGYGRRGNLTASGTFTPSPMKLKGSVTVKGIPLTDFDGYLPDNLAISIAGGALDARLNINLAHNPKGLTGTYGGSLGIRSFYCLETHDNEDLLKWERLQLNGVAGTLGPFGLSIGDASLTNFYSRVIITKNRTLNLQNLVDEKKQPAAQTAQPANQPPTPKPAPPARPAQPSAPPTADTAAKKNIKVGTVTLQGGTVVFSDLSLPTPFTTTFYNLGGSVSGLTSEETKVAQVDLRGNLQNQSPLAITGSINPLRDNLFLDMKISFTDIELSPITPYSGTYLGYAVDKGKLFLELKYHIENRNLTSENKIFFDQLTLGKKVESDRATKLPIRLAIALLKDRKGEIHLNLPVTGRTDDPKFSIWGIVFQVLRNLLVKAATSPFTLLQAAFGGKEDFNFVTFDPGSSRISPAERDKLVKLAEMIRDRPALHVEVSGYVDKEKDPEGYRSELLAKKMRTEKFLSLVKSKRNLPDQTPDTVEIPAGEYSAYLKAVYRKEKFSKPRNLIGLVKDIPDDEMKKLIYTHTPVGDVELQALARERSARVAQFLVETGKVERERVFQKSGDIYKPASKEGQGNSRVEFGAVVK